LDVASYVRVSTIETTGLLIQYMLWESRVKSFEYDIYKLTISRIVCSLIV
jgi:hypothetical protein